MKKILIMLLLIVIVFSTISCDFSNLETSIFDDYDTDDNINIENDREDATSNDSYTTTIVSTKAELPFSDDDYLDKNYTEIETMLLEKGFTNIKLIPVYDIVTGFLTSDGEVASVSINEEYNFNKGDLFEKNSEIVITYHTWKKNEPIITIPVSSDYFEGKSIEETTNYLEDLGFTNINTTYYSDDDYHPYDEVFIAEIGDLYKESWKKGDSYKSSTPINLRYNPKSSVTIVEESQYLQEVLLTKKHDYLYYSETYDGEFIQLNATVVSVTNIIGSTTITSITICYGDFIEGAFEGNLINVDMTDLTNSKPIDKNIKDGDKIKIIVKIDSYYAEYYKMICADVEYLEKIAKDD